jgi:NAD(P)-dependent dehydrogenase (short-subunit alcohol dehydrogenase family)
VSLRGQTVVVIGGTSGIGLETARLARAEGAEVILTARNADRLEGVGRELGATGTAAFDATDFEALARFLAGLPGQVDHVLVSGGGPYYAPLAELDFDEARRDLERHLWMPIHVARNAIGRVRPGGTLLFIGGTGGRRPGAGVLIAAVTAAMPALTRALALEVAPIRVNLIAPGFVDTPLSAEILGEGLEGRREELRETLPIGRVVGPEDVAALAVHVMANTALTGATFDVDGGQQLVADSRNHAAAAKAVSCAYSVSMYSRTAWIRPSRTVKTPMHSFSYGRPSRVCARLVHCRTTWSPSATIPAISRLIEPGS